MIIIYTDGSTLKNGTKDAEGGFGVVVCEGDPNQKPESYKVIAAHAERVIGTTNNRMEMSAILWALENFGKTADSEVFLPIVYSDSSYCVNSFTNWIKGWKSNGWVRAGGKVLENKDLIMSYDRLTSSGEYAIDLRHIRGHAGHIWNEVADKLATGRISPYEVMRDQGNPSPAESAFEEIKMIKGFGNGR